MSVSDSPWLDIPPERMARYEEMFRWSEATAHYYDGAALGPGLTIADFGCGPGHQAVEFARRLSPGGHVHALDINADFLDRTRRRARDAGLDGCVTTHLLTGPAIPLPDGALDRVIARNTLIHVPDPAACIAEFARVLRPGGLAHMIEGDRLLMAVEPVPPQEWAEFVAAAASGYRQPTIGRRLPGLARQAGFADCRVQVLTAPDMEGRLLPMLRNFADHALAGGLDPGRVEAVMTRIEQGLAQGSYLAVSPQFIVTAAR